MEGALPGSSAHGENPKFMTALADANIVHHVIVKFSPLLPTPVGQRWSDLLGAEHLAHEALCGAAVNAAVPRVHGFSDRTYLEVERFDRVGREGRSGVTSLLAIDAFHYAQLDHWSDSSARLHRDGRIDDQTLATVQLVATFGSLIANTDQHFGSLSFFDQYDGRFSFARMYDMLPMLFAPQLDQVSDRAFARPGPTSQTLRVHGRAHELAQRFWMKCASDERISRELRRICAACAESLQALPRSAFRRT